MTNQVTLLPPDQYPLSTIRVSAVCTAWTGHNRALHPFGSLGVKCLNLAIRHELIPPPPIPAVLRGVTCRVWRVDAERREWIENCYFLLIPVNFRGYSSLFFGYFEAFFEVPTTCFRSATAGPKGAPESLKGIRSGSGGHPQHFMKVLASSFEVPAVWLGVTSTCFWVKTSWDIN